MSRSYRLTETAQRQIEEISTYLADDNLDAALKVLHALEHAFEQLAANPGIGHTREDLTDRPVKFWGVFSYLVIYRPNSEPLEILSVVHGARDIRQILT